MAGTSASVVALVGIDGSGKTTQAMRLAAALCAAGVPARYGRNAGGRRFLGRVARKLGRDDAVSLLGQPGPARRRVGAALAGHRPLAAGGPADRTRRR